MNFERLLPSGSVGTSPRIPSYSCCTKRGDREGLKIIPRSACSLAFISCSRVNRLPRTLDKQQKKKKKSTMLDFEEITPQQITFLQRRMGVGKRKLYTSSMSSRHRARETSCIFNTTVLTVVDIRKRNMVIDECGEKYVEDEGESAGAVTILTI